MERKTRSSFRKAVKLTQAQYLALLKAVYIANWVANGTSSEDRHREFDVIEDVVFSQAKSFGLPEFSESKSTSDGRAYPTDEFEDTTDVHSILDEYDDDIFWETLVGRLAWRDLLRTYGQELLDGMDTNERAEKLSAFEEKYTLEVERYGIDRLVLPNARKTTRFGRN